MDGRAPLKDEPPPEGIQGVGLLDLDPHADVRGSLTELYRVSWWPAAPRVSQLNLSRSAAGVLRGMHVHRRQTDRWVVISGSGLVALRDLRSGSPSAGTTQTIEVDAPARLRAITIPPGVAHGFCAVTDLTLLYLVDQEFDGTDELGFAWNDPGLGVVWPVSAPVLSDRDLAAPGLTRFVAEQASFPAG